MAVRVSLGAGRLRILAMLLTESLVPALAGGMMGIVIAIGATRTVGSVQLPIGIPLEFDFTLDPRVLGFAVVQLVTGAERASRSRQYCRCSGSGRVNTS